MSEELCPCGSGLAYEACCGPRIDGTSPAEDAPALVRARYTAYVRKNYDFLVESHHPEFRGDMTAASFAEGMEHVEWTGLELGEYKEDLDFGSAGLCDTLELKASCLYRGEPRTLEEIGVFKKENGRVYYVDGLTKKPESYRRTEPKIGRNDPCPCGSGKKYKKCCGKAV